MPAPVVANASDRGDTRYDVSGLQWDPSRGAYVDDTGWHYDSNGLSLDRPNAYDPSKPAQNQFDERTGTYSTGGGGGGAVGGSDIFANPYYQQYASQTQAAQAADLADTKSQLQQLLIQFGMVPGNFQDKYGALDDTIRQLIQKNTESGISQYARLLQGKQDVQRDTVNQLASRGLSRSGAKGFALNRNQLDYDRTLSDSLNAVLGNSNQLQSGYAGRELQRQQGLSQFLAQLMANWRPTSASSSPLVPQPPSVPQPSQPQFTAPGFQNGVTRVGQPGAVQTGGGYYTQSNSSLNPNAGQMTAKWNKLAGI